MIYKISQDKDTRVEKEKLKDVIYYTREIGVVLIRKEVNNSPQIATYKIGEMKGGSRTIILEAKKETNLKVS